MNWILFILITVKSEKAVTKAMSTQTFKTRSQCEIAAKLAKFIGDREKTEVRHIQCMALK